AHTVARPRARIRRTNEGLANTGALMPDNPQSSAGIITKHSSESAAQTIDRLRRLMADRGFTVFNVIDHSGVAERAGVQMRESKLVMFGKPTVGAQVMLAAPLAALDIPLKVLVWDDGNGAVSVSYNSPEFLAERHHLEGALRAPFDAVGSIVEALNAPAYATLSGAKSALCLVYARAKMGPRQRSSSAGRTNLIRSLR